MSPLKRPKSSLGWPSTSQPPSRDHMGALLRAGSAELAVERGLPEADLTCHRGVTGRPPPAAAPPVPWPDQAACGPGACLGMRGGEGCLAVLPTGPAPGIGKCAEHVDDVHARRQRRADRLLQVDGTNATRSSVLTAVAARPASHACDRARWPIPDRSNGRRGCRPAARALVCCEVAGTVDGSALDHVVH